MTCYVKLLADSWEEQTRNASSDDEWDRGDSHTTWSISGAELVSTHQYESVPYPGELKKGDVVYAVYVVYSTGDSFGHDSDARLEFISVHKDKAIAERNLAAIESSQTPLEIHQDNGQAISMGYVPWEGYFESLSYARCEEFVLA